MDTQEYTKKFSDSNPMDHKKFAEFYHQTYLMCILSEKTNKSWFKMNPCDSYIEKFVYHYDEYNKLNNKLKRSK